MATEELINHQGVLEEKRLLEHRLIYGYYPEVVTSQQLEREILRSIAESVLYKDVLALEQIKKPATLERLLKALALQMGQEVSFQELGQIVEADKETVERYIYILEQAFIIFRLPAFSRNARNELKRARKIYFYDNGIRNSIIANFNALALRTDKEPCGKTT
jgi:predicted AAA+ superfamily ATPase